MVRLSIDEYLRTTCNYEPECEYIDGVLEPKASSDTKHSRLQALLTAWLIDQEGCLVLYTFECSHPYEGESISHPGRVCDAQAYRGTIR